MSIRVHFNQVILGASLILLSPILSASDSNSPATMLSTNAQNAADQFRLGRAYAMGLGFKQSWEKAGFWYTKAAEQGDARAMNNLGILFLEGLGTKKNPDEGYRWITKASDAGDPHAEFVLALRMLHGEGVPKDTAAGLELIKKSSEAGYCKATARLASDYLFGDDGMTKNTTQAIALLKKASEEGDDWACITLSGLYGRGEGVEKNLELSQSYALKADQIRKAPLE